MNFLSPESRFGFTFKYTCYQKDLAARAGKIFSSLILRHQPGLTVLSQDHSDSEYQLFFEAKEPINSKIVHGITSSLQSFQYFDLISTSFNQPYRSSSQTGYSFGPN